MLDELGVGSGERKKQSRKAELDMVLSGWSQVGVTEGVGRTVFQVPDYSLTGVPAPRTAVPRTTTVGEAPGHFIREVCFQIHPLSPIKSLT